MCPPGDDNDAGAFAWGCDLFDAGCFFEAHELWERCWLLAKVRQDVNDEALLHGLIRLAAAGVKLQAKQETARRSHVAGALACFSRITKYRRHMTAADVEAAAAQLLAGQWPCLP